MTAPQLAHRLPGLHVVGLDPVGGEHLAQVERLAGVLLVLALVARESRRTMVATLVLFLLVAFAQSALASVAESSAWVGGLHALDGIVILLISAWIALVAYRRRRSH